MPRATRELLDRHCARLHRLLPFRGVKVTESRYIEKKKSPSRLAQFGEPVFDEAEWLNGVEANAGKFVPFLTRKCGLAFRGRILEIGAGPCWFSAELSRLPAVLEVIATDSSRRLLRELAPRVFQRLNANAGKITRMPADFHRLDFPDRSFDFVVCANALHCALNLPQVLRECRRVLKPGGCFVAVREPVRPLVRFRSETSPAALRKGKPLLRSREEYAELFQRAGFTFMTRRLNLASGWKYYFNEMVNGLTHARYVFIARRLNRK